MEKPAPVLAARICSFPGHPRAPNFPLPEFFHSLRGMKGDFNALQEANLLPKTKERENWKKDGPDLEGGRLLFLPEHDTFQSW